MSVFRLEGGSARGGKMLELVREARAHEMLRREAALRATVAHIGLSLEDVQSSPLGPAQRVALVHSIPTLPAFKLFRAVSDGEVIPPRDRFAVELDGHAVWLGWWEWSQYAAQWRETSLTEWMAEALAPPAETAKEREERQWRAELMERSERGRWEF